MRASQIDHLNFVAAESARVKQQPAMQKQGGNGNQPGGQPDSPTGFILGRGCRGRHARTLDKIMPEISIQFARSFDLMTKLPTHFPRSEEHTSELQSLRHL